MIVEKKGSSLALEPLQQFLIFASSMELLMSCWKMTPSLNMSGRLPYMASRKLVKVSIRKEYFLSVLPFHPRWHFSELRNRFNDCVEKWSMTMPLNSHLHYWSIVNKSFSIAFVKKQKTNMHPRAIISNLIIR